MNGNDYLEIQEANWEQIEKDYIQAIKDETEEIPDEYITSWIDNYIVEVRE